VTTTTRYRAAPSRGDQRRSALLRALDDLLRSRPLHELRIAEITRAAGLTRSAFYFYFPTKAAAVAALLQEFYEELLAAASDWYDGTKGSPRSRLEAGFANSIALWRTRAYLLAAMLDASGSDRDVRELWEGWITRFVDRIAARIAEDRQLGIATGDSDPRALATVLMGAALHVMERDVRALTAGDMPDDSLSAALGTTWHRAIYAS
jgi:AcrR family transcriptional regulator